MNALTHTESGISTDADTTADAATLAGRLFESLVPAIELLTVELGTRRGLYAGLERLGDATYTELAVECDAAPRYVREWLEQQATAGFVSVAAAGDASARRYRLSEAHAAVLLDTESPYSMAGAATFLIGLAETFEAVVADFGRGEGVTYGDYGAPVRHAISSLNRPVFTHQLEDWLPALPDVDERLRRAASVIVDAGCGTGWSTIALARRYPLAQVIGIDLDAASITEAQAHLVETGLADRVRFERLDAGDVDALRRLAPEGVALVTVFEALHDMNDPATILAALGSVLESGGAILVGDEKVADEFTPDGDFLERLNYAFSVLHCLPATVAEGDGEANGTVLRTSTIRRWVSAAGLLGPTVLDIENDLWRFYRIDAG